MHNKCMGLYGNLSSKNITGMIWQISVQPHKFIMHGVKKIMSDVMAAILEWI